MAANKKYFKKYYEDNKKSMKQYQKEYYKNKKDELSKYYKERRENRSEEEKKKDSDYQKKYREKNIEAIRLATKRYVKNNKDKLDKYRKEYKQRPDVILRRKKYVEKNREKINRLRRESNKKKYAADPNFWKKRAGPNKNKKKLNARSMARTIKKLSYCELCSCTEGLERHHNRGYDYPKCFLTLCKRCHVIADSILAKSLLSKEEPVGHPAPYTKTI